jgi:hypothetical protein
VNDCKDEAFLHVITLIHTECVSAQGSALCNGALR